MSMRSICNDISFYKRAGLAAAAILMLAVPLSVKAQAQKLKVVASFSILADLTREVAGDRAEITSIVGPNADAHLYRATPNDAKSLAAAQLIVMNGLGFEGFMPRLIASSGSKAVVVTATKGIKPLEVTEKGHDHGHSHGKHDPHAWQSIEAAKRYLLNIKEGLIAVDPAARAVYEANAEAAIARLTALDAELRALIASIPVEKRIIITNHDAFGYFGRDFAFQMQSVQGISTEAEPSAKDVARIIREAKAAKARAVFVENMTDPRIAERLAKEAGAKLGGTLYSDALTDEKGPAPTYIAMMRHNVQTLVGALKD
jgi:zinc/manganese transport system substrate-binding protein